MRIKDFARYQARVRFLNRIIRLMNWGLPFTARIPYLPSIPFHTESAMEAATWQYLVLLERGLADWHDNGSVDLAQIRSELNALSRKHGKALKKYLAPYRNVNPQGAASSEFHRARVAASLFKTAESA